MDDEFWILLIGTLVLYLLIAPALGIAAFFRGDSGTAGELAGLRKRLDDLSAELAAVRRRGVGPEAPAAPTQASESPAPARRSALIEDTRSEPEEGAKAGPESGQEQPEAQPQAPESGGEKPPAAPPAAAVPGMGIEQWLTSRGLIWLGGITLALAGLFLAKYTYERGWLALGPAARCAAGFLFGLLLTAGGEWLRRRPLQRAIAAIGPNYLPPALTAAGLSSAFASVYAAYALYGLLPPLAAFLLLALVAFAAFALALLQGPLIAALALLGGFVTPLLVASPEPSAWGLFAYLLALCAASLAITRYVASWWLAWGTLVGAALWPLFWFAALWSPWDSPAVGIYLLLLTALFLGVRYRAGEESDGSWPFSEPDLIAWAGALTTALLGFILARMDGYDPASLITVFLLAGLYLAAAWRAPVFEGLVLVGAVLALALLGLWHLPAIGDWPAFTHDYRGEGYAGALGPVVPPQLTAFVLVCLGFGALFAIAGFLALGRARRPAIWAGVSAALPVLLLAVAYWRVTGLGVDLAWSASAIGLAVLGLGAGAGIRRHPPRPPEERLAGDSLNALLLGIYALGSVAAFGLAFAMALEQAWLTVALSLLLPAVAWISTELKLRSLRPAAYAVAGVVLLRLVLNYNILDYPLGEVPGFNWILYGYGVPMLAFWWAARRFRRLAGHQDGDLLVLLLEGGAMVLAWLLVTLEIRSFVAGDLGSRFYDLAEQSLQTVAWLAMAYGWLRAYRRSGRWMLLWGWRLLAGLAALHSALFPLLLGNPLWSVQYVGTWPLLNLLALAYLVPGIFALLFARELKRDGQRKPAMAAAVYALLLIFVWLSMEVRHAFHGAALDLGRTGDGELLAYSLVWLGYAWVLFGGGLKTGFASLRYASLAVLAVATAKVLLFDWSALEGLYRFVSFTALGFSLLGIPFLYQKLVFPPGAVPPAAEAVPLPDQSD